MTILFRIQCTLHCANESLPRSSHDNTVNMNGRQLVAWSTNCEWTRVQTEELEDSHVLLTMEV